MDYNSHHSLHYNTHISIQHCTNHTAVTNHSLTLIVSPHLHLIHTHTYKQHTSLHSPQSLVLPWLTFWVFPCILFPWTAYMTLTICCLPSWPCLPCDILSVCRLPRPLHCPCCWFCLAFITPVTAFDHCLSDLLLSVLKLQLDLTSLPLRYRDIQISYFKNIQFYFFIFFTACYTITASYTSLLIRFFLN